MQLLIYLHKYFHGLNNFGDFLIPFLFKTDEH